MIKQIQQQNQLPNEIKPGFKELKVLQHLKTAGFKKKFGFPCSFLFQLVFVLLFHHKKDRISVFVVDDSMFERNRSKAVELLSRFKDHATGCYYKGFRMLTLGWSDGHTFIPVDFSLLASLKSQVNGIMEGIDKRTSGFKRRIEFVLPAPQVIPTMIDSAILRA